MNEHELKGRWKQLNGEAQRKWGELTDDDLDQIKGSREILVGKLQERYGKGRDVVDKEVDQWFESLDDSLTRTRD
jgi:uncharacterized protein YjbJ (UPF0337 family)